MSNLLALLLSVLLSFFLNSSGINGIEIQDCGSSAEILAVEISNCDKTPCVFQHGENVRGVLKFKPKNNISKLTCALYASVGFMEMPYDCPEADACKSIKDASCPLKADQTYVYDIGMEISESYPAVEATGRWVLSDQDDKEVVCFKFDIEITAKKDEL